MVIPNEEALAQALEPRESLEERRAQFEREALVHLDAMYSFALKLARGRDDADRPG